MIDIFPIHIDDKNNIRTALNSNFIIGHIKIIKWEPFSINKTYLKTGWITDDDKFWPNNNHKCDIHYLNIIQCKESDVDRIMGNVVLSGKKYKGRYGYIDVTNLISSNMNNDKEIRDVKGNNIFNKEINIIHTHTK